MTLVDRILDALYALYLDGAFEEQFGESLLFEFGDGALSYLSDCHNSRAGGATIETGENYSISNIMCDATTHGETVGF